MFMCQAALGHYLHLAIVARGAGGPSRERYWG